MLVMKHIKSAFLQKKLYILPLACLTNPSFAAGQSIDLEETSSPGIYDVEVDTGTLKNIKRVKLFVNGSQVGYQDLRAPYIWEWDATDYAGKTVKILSRAINKNNVFHDKVLNVSIPSSFTTDDDSSSLVEESVDNVFSIKTASNTNNNLVNVEITTGSLQNIDRVKLFINGSQVGYQDRSAPYTWTYDSTDYIGSSVSARAVAVDTKGNYWEVEKLIDFSKVDTLQVAESLTIDAPANASGTIDINVDATDPDGIHAVKLFVGGVLVGQDTTSPYSFQWDSSSYAGSTVDAEAVLVDKLGNVIRKSTSIDVDYVSVLDYSIAAVSDIAASVNTSTTTSAVTTTVASTAASSVPPESYATPSSGKSFVSDFESGDIQAKDATYDGWSPQDQGIDAGIQVVKGFSRSGNHSVKMNINKSNWDGSANLQGSGSPRAQLVKSSREFPIKMNKEYWLGVSTFIPTTWTDEQGASNNTEVLWQFHGSNGGPGQGKSPPLNLGIRGDTIYVANRTGAYSDKVIGNDLWTAPLANEKGKWTDWVIRVKFSLKNDGIVQVWRNGVQIADLRNAPTIYEGKDPSSRASLFIALSLYKPKFVKVPTTVRNHTMYYDEFNMFEGTNGYSKVDPSK